MFSPVRIKAYIYNHAWDFPDSERGKEDGIILSAGSILQKNKNEGFSEVQAFTL